MNRSLKLSILLALALGSTQAAAVELGQAHVKSALGQPLLVDIPVTQATAAELQSLSAQLASNDAFAKVGGQRPTIPLQFNLVNENGHRVIRVTSSASVDDPYLDLLVEVHSNAGSTVREFAILLDPANKVGQAASSSAPAHHPAPAATASAQSEAAPAPRRAPAHSATAEVKNGQFGPVEKGQTLSHIATEVAPSGVNTDQMMLALKAANPDAFYRDNINALKAGAILRVPSRDDALTTAIAQAAAAVREQNSDWRNGAVSAPVAVAAGATRENSSVAPTANSNTDRLALVPPGSEGQTAGDTNGKGSAAVRQQLQRSQEMLASLQQQSNDLKSRLKDLEDINTKNQRLLSLKDDEIADLQKKLAQARKTAGMPPAAAVANAPAAAAAAAPAKVTPEATAPTPAAAPAPELANASTAPTKPLTAPASASTALHAAVTTPLNGPAKPVAHPVHHAPAGAPEEQPWYMQSWAWAAGGGVIVLLALGLLARRGKSSGKPTKVMPPIKGSLADRFGTVDTDEDGHPASGSDPDQDELLDQLAEQPDDIGLHLELVSLYYTRRDVEHFEAAAEAMHAHIADPNEPEWQDVVHMGRDLAPGHPLFVESTTASGQDDHPAPHHFDLDSYASRSEAEPMAPAKNPSTQPAKVSEYHFDFDLTPHHPDALVRTDAATTATQAEEPEPVSTWKFDDAAEAAPAAHTDHGAFEELHDDPVDTKLDLARAYLDMGDPDGARAMLEEVLHEGTQMQKDVARQLMEKIH
ncbi:fimbrial protein FimV [Dyella monticola]|uniref:Fimbrial protein FimV n=1 Tax=Dyella monticola TaxID=1927958 RepID=A0A370WUV8_9GAMM|nr:FimV/HubP family polar landmark protein [Dyella monticola]RDS79841.1 fimbrial protein FimV [Dyella monticola]